jgi:glycosyltransferase involved in cell wall biosynthesis
MISDAHPASGYPGRPVTPTPTRRAAPLQIVCLSPQPWAVDLPTNRQQLMRRAAALGHEVLFVETGPHLGRAVLEPTDGLRRAALRRLVRPEIVEPGVRVLVAPNVAPWGHRFALAARVNAMLAARAIRRLARGGERLVLWLYDPCFADAIGACGERLAVYDCVDDYAEQAGADRRKRALVRAYDARTAERSRLVFATTPLLRDRHLALNPRTHLVPNVGDYEHFAPAADRGLAPDDLRSPEETVVGFAGNFLESKVDFGLLEAIARGRPEWTLLLVGPARAETAAALERLARLPNVRRVGQVPYGDLPRYVAAFDVGLIPYLENDYTRSCFPLKLYEYLAAGKPVVATGLPHLRDVGPLIRLSDGVEDTLSALADGLARRSPEDVAERQALARSNTWETRAERLLGLVQTELSGQAG